MLSTGCIDNWILQGYDKGNLISLVIAIFNFQLAYKIQLNRAQLMKFAARFYKVPMF